MTKVSICIEYNFSLELDTSTEEEFEIEFNKLKEIIKEDTEKFVLSNIDNSIVKKRVLFELCD